MTTIASERDARIWVAQWVAVHGNVRRGILTAVVDGLRKSLAIMDGSPGRYSFADREDLREAIAYLTSTDWTQRPVQFEAVAS